MARYIHWKSVFLVLCSLIYIYIFVIFLIFLCVYFVINNTMSDAANIIQNKESTTNSQLNPNIWMNQLDVLKQCNQHSFCIPELQKWLQNIVYMRVGLDPISSKSGVQSWRQFPYLISINACITMSVSFYGYCVICRWL